MDFVNNISARATGSHTWDRLDPRPSSPQHLDSMGTDGRGMLIDALGLFGFHSDPTVHSDASLGLSDHC